MSERAQQAAQEHVEAIHHKVEGKVNGDPFGRFAAAAASWLGSRWAFIGAAFVVFSWAVLGPYFHYSNNWQLVINTGTTIVTFLMVFLIQNTQNRESRAMNLKLDELIHSIGAAQDKMMHIEQLSDAELDELQEQYRVIREEYVRREERTARRGTSAVEDLSTKP